MWNATPEQIKAGEEIKKKLFSMVEDDHEYLKDKHFRQQIKSLYVSYIIMTDTDIDKSDSDRLLYDLWEEIRKYVKWDFQDYEDMMLRCFC